MSELDEASRLKSLLKRMLPKRKEPIPIEMHTRLAKRGKRRNQATSKELAAAKKKDDDEHTADIVLGKGNPKRKPYSAPHTLMKRKKVEHLIALIGNLAEENEIMEWTAYSNRLSALVEELRSEELDETEIEESDDSEDLEEAFSDDELVFLAEMLGVDADDLLDADEDLLGEAMHSMKMRVMKHPKYGRPGAHMGKHPWHKNEKSVGHALQHAKPKHTGTPGAKSAKVPKHSSAPYARKGHAHARK